MKLTTREGEIKIGSTTIPTMGLALESIELNAGDVAALYRMSPEDVKFWMGVMLTRFPPKT
jgi:hypothetical protein